jgi:hypothetical protein
MMAPCVWRDNSAVSGERVALFPFGTFILSLAYHVKEEFLAILMSFICDFINNALSVAQSMYRRIDGDKLIMNWKALRRKRLWPNFKALSRIRLDGPSHFYY